MNFYRLISIACATLFFCNVSFAQDWYQIEVIAFEYTHPNQNDVELWDNHPGEPDWKASVNLTDEATARTRRTQEEAAKRAAAPPPPPAPVPAPVEEASDDDDEAPIGTRHASPAPAPTPPPQPQGQKFVSVEEILTGQHDQTDPAINPPFSHAPLSFVALPASQYTMGDIEGKLHKQSTYRVLTHTAWRQLAFTGNNDEGVHIFGGRVLDHDGPIGARYEFEGMISLKSTRYLHLDVDALLREASSKELGSRYHSPADLGLLESTDRGQDKAHVYQVYRLEQSQRVRSNKVYYFDHPLMGVIVKISPYGG